MHSHVVLLKYLYEPWQSIVNSSQLNGYVIVLSKVRIQVHVISKLPFNLPALENLLNLVPSIKDLTRCFLMSSMISGLICSRSALWIVKGNSIDHIDVIKITDFFVLNISGRVWHFNPRLTDTLCNTTNEGGGGYHHPWDFQNEPPYDAYFGTSG